MDPLQILWVSRSQSFPHAAVKPHTHPYYHLFYICKGKCCFSVESQSFELTCGQFILVPKNTRHGYSNQSTETIHSLEVKFSLAGSALDSRLSRLEAIPCDNELVGALLEKTVQEYSALGAKADASAASYLYSVLNLLTERERLSEKRNFRYIDANDYSDLSKKIVLYLEKNYAKDLSLDSLSEAVGYNKSYLCVAFKKNTGRTILDCLNMIRIRRAAELIVYSDHSLSQVAERCGFASVSHFNQVFLKYVGITPGHCRKAYPPEIITHPDKMMPADSDTFMYSVLAHKLIPKSLAMPGEK